MINHKCIWYDHMSYLNTLFPKIVRTILIREISPLIKNKIFGDLKLFSNFIVWLEISFHFFYNIFIL